LSEKYTNLLGKTDLNYNYSKDDLNFYGLNVMPEAYAGLSSITQQQRLETGMSLLVDIGGGTTDIAFFTITDNQPDIHAVISFPKGLNFVFEKYIHQNGRYSIIDIQEMFFMKSGDKLIFNGAINEYKSELLTEVQKIIDRIRLSFEARRIHHNHPTSRLLDALKNRPAVFCGGGAIYESMQTTLLNFTDIKLISKSLLNIPFIINQNIEDKLFTILATSYGLSIPLENEIVLTPIEKVFNHLDAPETTDFDYKYDHGLSDY
jgi:hypothetical protein